MEETETVLTLADFGALLHEKRVQKGLTEENVAAQLKITSRLVKAIEEGDMDSMPHAVYARGFIRAYAKLLAVDDSVTHAACALLKDPEEELREQEIRVVPAAARREVRVPWLAILLCALFLASGAWYFRDVIPGLSANTDSQEKTAAPAVSSPAVPEEAPAAATPDVPVEPTANATLPAVSEEPIILGGTPLPAENETAPAAQEALPATGHRILLTAQGDCWVSTTADGKNSQRVMHKGDTLNVDFQEKLVMKLGNAGAMQITYDGKELSPAGKIGQVKTVTFPDDALN